MILHGNQRGGGRDLAAHLMKPENERVELVEMRGFIADNLKDAFVESYAVSKATRCRQHLFSLSINPPAGADIKDEDYVDAADRVEKELGLTRQPRAIVRHWKRGDDGVVRSHAHAVWCRIDVDQMKAVHLPFTKRKLREVSRELHLHHDLNMPPGLINSKDRDPRNFTLEQWQQCKRAKKDIHRLQEDFRDAWSISDSAAAFTHALEERGYILAKGKRGHVAVDFRGEVYAVRTYTGKTSKEIQEKLGTPDRQPSVVEAQTRAARQLVERLTALRVEQLKEIASNRAGALELKEKLQLKHERQMVRVRERHRRQQAHEVLIREARLRKGLPGLWDWLTGKRKRTLELNKAEAAKMANHRREELRAQRNRRLTVMKAQDEKSRLERMKHFEGIRELRDDAKRLMQVAPKESTHSRTSRPRRRSRIQFDSSLER
ncbi:relaxase/mobilization nuclease domain-containing protein [Roseibium litorale]|uniref:Relaxase n=1 Tax=Roseibium litorale TaxID=2803841 RepID=A0ABR9CTA9_9HYPH|nr:relaxase [Roseibium litorale]MBD8894122.1 relaxase [Roseibium litorale]